jgi:5-formyltetrahydrofolate cyclo-ligase
MAAVSIAKHVGTLARWQAAKAVLLYASFASEVDTRPLLELAWGQDKTVGLPRMDGRELAVHMVLPDTALAANRHGIPEPPRDAPLLSTGDLGVVLVPGVAFDRRGGRLGYGGGYYDRLLGTVPHAFRVGVAYEAQVVEHLPTSLLDVPMDVLVTESGVHVLPTRKH